MSAAAEPLWKVPDVARYLSLSTSWVYKEAEAGRLPCLRIGASLRFRPEAIRRWVECQSPEGTSPKVLPLKRNSSTGVDKNTDEGAS